MRPLSVVFFLLPVALVFGVATQAAAVYLLGILLPAVLLGSRWRNRVSGKMLAALGCGFVVLYSVFPLANIWNFPRFMPDQGFWHFISETGGVDFFRGPITSGVVLSGVALLLAAALAFVRPASGAEGQAGVLPEPDDRVVLRAFVFGMAAASIVLVSFATIEHFTSFTWRPFTSMPAPSKNSDRTFRPYGFYGGPLHLASVSLAWLSLAWVLFWHWVGARLARGSASEKNWLASGSSLVPVALVVTVVAHFWCILMTAGRTALAVGLVVLVAVPLLQHVPRLTLRARLVTVGMISALALTAGVRLSLAARFSGSLGSAFDPERSSVALRLTGWKVHWALLCDNWFLGQGFFWINSFVRKNEYLRLGYTSGAKSPINAHNIFLEAAASLGVFGILILLGSVATVWFFLMRASRRDVLARPLFAAFVVASLANLAHGLTENSFFSSNVAYVYLGIFWVLVWTVAARRPGTAEPRPKLS